MSQDLPFHVDREFGDLATAVSVFRSAGNATLAGMQTFRESTGQITRRIRMS